MTEEMEVKSLWNRPSIKYGIIGGVITALIYAVYYFMDESLFGHPFFSSFPLLVLVIISILAGLEKRKSCGGFVAFGNVLGAIFGSFMIGLVINTAFMLLLFFVIDTELPARLMEIGREKLAIEIEKGKYPKESLENFDQAVEKTGIKRMMLFQSIGSLLFFSAIGLIISLIAAAFIRKEPKY